MNVGQLKARLKLVGFETSVGTTESGTKVEEYDLLDTNRFSIVGVEIPITSRQGSTSLHRMKVVTPQEGDWDDPDYTPAVESHNPQEIWDKVMELMQELEDEL